MNQLKILRLGGGAENERPVDLGSRKSECVDCSNISARNGWNQLAATCSAINNALNEYLGTDSSPLMKTVVLIVFIGESDLQLFRMLLFAPKSKSKHRCVLNLS